MSAWTGLIASHRPAVAKGGPVTAIYFGGGTPSALSAEQLSRLIAAATAQPRPGEHG